MSRDQETRRFMDRAAEDKFLALLVILGAVASGLWALGVPHGASLVILGVITAAYCVALSWNYPDAMDREGWDRWRAERDTSD